MCGIAGILNFDGRQVTKTELKSMTDCMVHRGPDDEGFFIAGSVGLGMRRLSIIDVVGGHQPLKNERGDLHLILNGEIYNHVELRQQLTYRGHVFQTASDAEVVLHLYEEKGINALDDLNGMFALALYDSRRQALWIARDRLGIKPLFYVASEEGLKFASDIGALRKVHTTEVEPKQVLKYLALSYSPGAETVWRGIRKLLPAHYLWIEGGQTRLERYWSVKHFGTWRGTVEEAQKQLEVLLRDAIRLQLRSDVPLGVFLSGGLDSSAIVALATDQISEPLRTFTVCFAGKSNADEIFARRVAQDYGTIHSEISMSWTDATSVLKELLPLMDEPLSDAAWVPAYWLSKAAQSQGIKVLLNGAGGDEIFGGYGRYWPAKFGSPSWVAGTLPKAIRLPLAAVWSTFQPHRAVRATDPINAWAASISGVNLYALRQLLRSPEDYSTLLSTIHNEYGDLAGFSEPKGYFYTRMSNDLQKYLPEDVLSLTDKATMAASVEGRVPLLDHRLVEFAFSLPPEINLFDHKPKGLLKRVMRHRLPADLLQRPKEGFNPPTASWLQVNHGSGVAEELLEASTSVVDDLVDRVVLEEMLAKPARRDQAAETLLALYLFNRWHRVHLAS